MKRPDFNVENIGEIFSFLKQSIRNGERRYYRIEADGVEIVAKTGSLDPFSDFLNYRYPQASRINFFIYRPDGSLECAYEFDLQAHAKRLARISSLSRENRLCRVANWKLRKLINAFIDSEQQWIKLVKTLDAENKQLKAGRKAEDIETVKQAKVLDAGDSLIMIVPKKEIEQTIIQHLKAAGDVAGLLDEIEKMMSAVKK
ncbi:MAG: hypothetical protein AB1458_12050 [Bacteroidota bacterium]